MHCQEKEQPGAIASRLFFWGESNSIAIHNINRVVKDKTNFPHIPFFFVQT